MKIVPQDKQPARQAAVVPIRYREKDAPIAIRVTTLRRPTTGVTSTLVEWSAFFAPTAKQLFDFPYGNYTFVGGMLPNTLCADSLNE